MICVITGFYNQVNIVHSIGLLEAEKAGLQQQIDEFNISQATELSKLSEGKGAKHYSLFKLYLTFTLTTIHLPM